MRRRMSGLVVATSVCLAVLATNVFAADVTVKFMNWWGGERVDMMNEVITNFNKEHPEIIVENLVQPWDNREEVAATAIASSEPPSLIMVPRVETYKFAYEGLILPITDYVKASGIDPDEMFYAGEINNQRWDGELYSFPLPTAGGITGQYLYNTDLLTQAGFDQENLPKTWQDMEKVAEAVTMADKLGIDILGADVGTTGEAFVSWLYTNNGKMVSDDAKTLLFNSPEGVETLEWMVNFTNTYNGGVENVREFWEGVRDTNADWPYYTDRVAMWFTNVSAFGHLKTHDADMWNDTSKWGVALRPYNGNNPNAASHGISGLSFAWGYVIPKNQPKEVLDAAYTFLQFLGTNESGGCQFLFVQGRPSPVKTCNENSAYYEANPYWEEVMASLDSDVSIPVTPVQSQINDILNAAVDEVFFGVKTSKEALDEAAAKSQKILDEFWAK